MSSISSLASNTPAPQPVGNSIKELDLDVFLELMLAELQNQDPLDPTDNAELLNTISQIREISANDRLSETLDSVLLGQNVATATSLIGTEVEGVTDGGQPVSGLVQRVAINDGQPALDIAVESKTSAGEREGEVAEGDYNYEVVWESEGTRFSVQVPASTSELGDEFAGSIRLENLPQTDTPKKVYRTDRTGSGDLHLIGSLPAGRGGVAFTDTVGDAGLGKELLTGSRQVIRFADSVTIKLNNVRNVQTL
ncbi:flagellar hook capping FlgD N-terminal domain-containing protein [Botrimarina sp.]|uniref:flagellar hook assembly protein FlgD n=1 Tax=Botrimarina sp. TaxID=2795802 RepID=UPI0032EE022D